MKINKKIISGIFAVTLLSVSLSPAVVFAQASQASDGGVATDNPKSDNFQIVPCSGTIYDSEGKPTGVDCDFNQLLNMINRIIKFLLYLSIPLVLGIIIFTAFKFLTANGDPGKLADAKRMLIPVAIGLFWVLASYIVVYTILDKLLADKTKSNARGIFEQYFKK